MRSLLVALAACGAMLGPAHAAGQDKLSECADLGADSNTSVFGTQYVLIEDGEAHYRLRFRGETCSALSQVPSITITSDGHANRLCPQGTKVKSKRGSCDVIGVDAISGDRYKAYRRTRR